MKALEIAKRILNYQLLDYTLEISHLKLQKLLFYCQAYHLSISGEPLFEDDILAWDYGPVVRSVYENYKKHDSSIISVKKELKSEDISATSNLANHYSKTTYLLGITDQLYAAFMKIIRNTIVP
ncbi:MAG: DUF4065 domain-containing protein [Endomicrobium sp.]|nr:DUF4065 domain-containing protein [Endomicrobium sp.]